MSYKFSFAPKKVPLVNTRYRKIKTKIPAPGTVSVLKKSLKYEPLSMNVLLPLVWDRAIDYRVYDAHGNVWIDFTSGIFVANAGHSNKETIAAAKSVLEKPLLHTFLYPTSYRANLAEKLVKISPEGVDKALILSTGAEVTETALKIARIWGEKQSKKKNIIVAFEGAFHGETIGAKTMSGSVKAKEWIGVLDPNIVHLPYPTNYLKSLDVENSDFGSDIFEHDIKQLGKKINLKNIAGFMIESYQGWAAMFFPRGYVKALRKFADKNKSLVMFDEVQAGFGRTGKLFACEYYGIKADVICCGKGISGGLPLSAVLSRNELLNVDSSGLNSTHAGNPVSCAAALANINYLVRNKLSERAYKKGQVIYKFLLDLQKEFPERIKSIHGKGFAYAAVVTKPKTSELDVDLVDTVVEKAFQKGLLMIRTGKGSIKLGPPLTISEKALIEGLNVLRESFIESTTGK
jgi:4-aminobutyrate aminotransferase / (S)-3-amino-2-methylpropionate transaminase / 5-aminovalerate transaminase